MSEYNKSYRIRTKIGVTDNSPIEDKYLTVKLTERFESIDIMSLKIKQENAYKFHSADYGVVVGRAIANGGFGVPNVKVSVFIAATEATVNDPIYNAIYPYERPTRKNKDNIRYNLLPDSLDDDCYQAVGTFPNKRLVLDDDNYLEIYDNYYKFTTRTNNAGDYMIFGIPTGGQILHFDADLSDVGVLSQKPRDMIYKGYNAKQFENPNQFKKDDNLANLPQIISQDDSVYIYPFWGDEDENIIGITRHDIDINYKFEPTCVFIGSIVSDTSSNHISKKCVPTESMGLMEEMITGQGTIEMIRKKQDGTVEQFTIQGNQLINENGIWCYQIPMNLDYVMTDEYGNLVPSNDPTKGIATRTKVRFRISMDEFQDDSANSFRAKVLVPNNPQNSRYEPDYVFGSFTEEESFRDLLWNNVYTVKSFIPRFQKGNGNKNRRFSGVKQCNYHGTNNPIPYNNMRINLSFQFVITCLLVRLLIWIVGVYNAFITALANALSKFINSTVMKAATKIRDWFKNVGGNGLFWRILRAVLSIVMLPIRLLAGAIAGIGDFFRRMVQSLSCVYLDGSMCDTLEGSWFFAPNCGSKRTISSDPNYFVWRNMMAKIEGKKLDQIDYSSSKSKTGGGMKDKQSIDESNADSMTDEENAVKITIRDANGNYVGEQNEQYIISRGINYFVQCIEISLAQEFRVIQFDFYNDWINGMIYIPKWERSLKKKRKYFLFGKSRIEIRACNDVYKKRFFERRNYLTEQCGISYKAKTTDNSIGTKIGCKDNKKYKCHKKKGRKQFKIFDHGGVVHQEATASGLYAYYFKPCEYFTNRNSAKNRKVNLFATDIVLLGSLVDCDLNGTPLFTDDILSTTYQIPSPLAHTDSTDEGFSYAGVAIDGQDIIIDDYVMNGRAYESARRQLSGAFDYTDSAIEGKDDGSVTEAAGIDWGYTGPGQGEVKKAKAYTPGGHFLGISCVNAESTIKSCVNLKRICEIGVWPSSRQEAFNGYDAGNNGMYVDIIPNGLIAKDEIAGENFRKMFATMNQNNLKTKVNDSGFTVYDFMYMTPENFGGEFSKYTKSNYNEPNPLSELSMSRYLAKRGDENDYGEIYDADDTESKEISVKPIRRSLDDRDRDYMRFRLGLEKDTNSTIQSKYLGSNEYGYYMPVYNNSFYFYFGLVPGSTALDEFHKQFFAECKQTMTTDDLRLVADLSYSRHCCGGKICSDAFASPVELSIFETNLVFNKPNDYLRIFSTALPIKIIIDSVYSYTIKSFNDVNVDSQSNANRNYIKFFGWNVEEDGDIHNVFNFKVGKHTINITDSNGMTTTKLVEVVQQDVTLCPEIEGIPFSDGRYIINSTRSLITSNGLKVGPRDSLGGWFLFDWSNTACTSGALFTYHDMILQGNECVLSPEHTVMVGEATLLFVGRGHIITFGSQWDVPINTYEEFVNYTSDDIIAGASSTAYGYHVFAGEEGIYDLYVLYKTGNKKTQPILLQDNIYIGEPDAIDFDVFRDIIESEEDSPVTFRNPVVKIWYDNQNYWYRDLYPADISKDELTATHKWYIKKMLYYVVEGYKDTDKATEDFNENFTSERKVYVNLYYPTTVGNVLCKIDGVPGNSFDKTHGYATVNSQIITYHSIEITGRTVNPDQSGSPILYTPMIERGGVFRFPIFYKPYYYNAVVWEGYTSALQNAKSSYGHVNGIIYNGIVYDTGIGEQSFGPTWVNERFRIDSSVNVTFMRNDFENDRVSPIRYTGDSVTTFSDSSNILLITEGSPKNYEGVYTPVEYSIESNVIGVSTSWQFDFTMEIVNGRTNVWFDVTFENNDYEQVNWYWSSNKDLNNVRDDDVIFTAITKDDVINSRQFQMYDSLPEITSETYVVHILLPSSMSPDRTGKAPEIKNGMMMFENVTHDNRLYSEGPGQFNLGFLSSRNCIRNGINIDYTFERKRLELSSFTTVSGFYKKKKNAKIKKGKAKRHSERGKVFKHGGFGTIKLYLPIPIYKANSNASLKFRKNIGQNVDSVIVYINDSHVYDLINDLGYSYSYKGGVLVFDVSEPDSENASLFDESGKVEDGLTKFLEGKFDDFGGYPKAYGRSTSCRITIKSSGLSNAEDGYNDTIDNVKLEYDAKITFVNKEVEGSDDEDD